MKKSYLVAFLFLIGAVALADLPIIYSGKYSKVTTERGLLLSDGNVVENDGEFNVLKNSGCELDSTYWTASGGTFNVTTTAANVGQGTKSCYFNASATGQTVCSDAITISGSLGGLPGTAECKTKTAASDYLLKVKNNGVTAASYAMTASASAFTVQETPFTFPATGGTVQLCIESQSDAAIIYFDSCHIKEVKTLSNVPSGNVSSTTVQGAINELQSDIDTRALDSDFQTHISGQANTHVQIDSHISNTSNPHSVTAAQVGNATAQWNANKLQDVDLNLAGIGDGKILKYNSGSGDFEMANDVGDVAGGNANAVLGKTADNLSSEWKDIVGTSNEVTVSHSAGQIQLGIPSSITADLVGNVTGNVTGNVSGTAANVTGIVAAANGGHGQNTLQLGMNALAGGTTGGQYLRGNGTNVVMSAIQAADVPTLNQNTTGTASNVTGTVAVANGGTGATDAATARTNLDAQQTIAAGIAGNVATWNGSAWVPGDPQVSAGTGVTYFYDNTASGVLTYETLEKVPAGGVTVDESAAVTSGTSPVTIDTYINGPLGGTQIDGGVWDFHHYGYVSLAAGVTKYRVTVKSRTVGGVETTHFTTDSPEIDNTTAGSIEWTTVQPSFAIAPTDRLVIVVQAITTSVGSVTLHFLYEGTENYSHVTTPLITRHNDLAALQGGTSGEYYHLTSSQHTVATSATSANTASAVVQRDGSGNFSAGTITAALTGNASTATTAAGPTNATTFTATLDNFVGDSGSGGTKGLVPAPATGDGAAAKVLRADGTWGAAGTASPLTTKGDLYVYSTTNDRKAVGSYGKTLKANALDAAGVEWADNKDVPKNYIQYSDAEDVATGTDYSTGHGWATYDDTTAVPVDGTGGTVTTSWTTTTTNPIHGASSFLLGNTGAPTTGEGASYSLTLDRGDLAKVLTVAFDYEFTDVTGYATNDVQVWWIDDTGGTPVARPVTPSGVELCAVSTQCRFSGEIQTHATAQAARLLIHVADGSAFKLKIDDVFVGRRAKVFGAPVTDWGASFSPTLSNSTGVNSNLAQKRRVGDTEQIQGKISWNGGGDGTAFIVTLPSTIDTTKQPLDTNSVLGVFQWLDSGTNWRSGTVNYASTTTVVFKVDSASDNLLGTGFANGDVLSYQLTYPVTGWSSSLQLSDSASTRRIAFRADRNGSNQTGFNPNNSGVKVLFNSLASAFAKDDSGTYSTTNSRYDVSVPGRYHFDANVALQATNVLASRYFIYLQKNGTTIAIGSDRVPVVSTIVSFSVSADIDCVAGDYIEVGIFGAGNNSASTLTVEGGAANTYFSGYLIQGPSAIAASETVSATFTTPATTAISGAGAVHYLDFGTKKWDTHGAVLGAGSGHVTTTLTGWRFVAPVSGIYRVVADILINSSTPGFDGATEYGSLTSIGSDRTANLMVRRPPSTEQYPTWSGSAEHRLLAGQTIQIGFAQVSGGNLSLDAGASNSVSITRVGNY